MLDLELNLLKVCEIDVWPWPYLDKVCEADVCVPCLIEFLSVFLDDECCDVCHQILNRVGKVIRKTFMSRHLRRKKWVNDKIYTQHIFHINYPQNVHDVTSAGKTRQNQNLYKCLDNETNLGICQWIWMCVHGLTHPMLDHAFLP